MADDTDLDAASEYALANMARVRPVLDKIADKWTILILTVLFPRPSRFNAIKRQLDGITHKALADALKRLERNGLVTRTVLPTARSASSMRLPRSAIRYTSPSRRSAPGPSTTVRRSRRPTTSTTASERSRESASCVDGSRIARGEASLPVRYKLSSSSQPVKTYSPCCQATGITGPQ